MVRATAICVIFLGLLGAISVRPALAQYSSFDDDHSHAVDDAAHGHGFDTPPRSPSWLHFVFQSLGPFYLLAIPAAGLLAVVLAGIVVLRGGPHAGAALVFIVSMPLLVGVYAAISGLTNSFMILAYSGTTPKPSELAVGYSVALVGPLFALWCMAPSFLVALVGLIWRTFTDRQSPNLPK